MKIKQQVVLGIATAISLAYMPAVVAQTTTIAETATVISACGKLFEIDSNAAGMTAPERAAIIQKNLDYALIHARNRTPDAVSVLVVNRNPVVTLDGYHIATADGNSASRHMTSQMALAQDWASKIRFCLADATAVNKYLSMLTGKFPVAAAVFPKEERVAYAPAGMYLPVKLLTPISSEASMPGDRIEAQLMYDVPLTTSQASTEYEAYLPAGTMAVGRLIDDSCPYLGKGALGLRFDHLRTPDGETIPIQAHILGGPGSWVFYHTDPRIAQYANVAGTRLAPGNGLVAAKGNVCGGWTGAPIEQELGIPYSQMVLQRRTGIDVAAGEPMMMQLGAPTTVALCTNCAESNAVATETVPIVPVAIGGAGAL